MKWLAPLAALMLSIGLGIPQVVQADEFKVPALSSPVVDKAHFLSASAKNQLTQALVQIKAMTGGTEIAVLTVPDLGGSTIEQRSIEVVDAWKLGAKGKDTGVLLFLSKAERKVRIEVGRRFEGDLTDAYSKRIISQTIIPSMKDGNADQAILMGVVQIVAKIHPELDIKKIFGATAKATQKQPSGGLLSLLPLVFFLIFAIGGRRGGGRGGLIAGMLLGSMMSGGRGYGGGGGGSFGGGGFGGGGGFSGGGASGGW